MRTTIIVFALLSVLFVVTESRGRGGSFKIPRQRYTRPVASRPVQRRPSSPVQRRTSQSSPAQRRPIQSSPTQQRPIQSSPAQTQISTKRIVASAVASAAQRKLTSTTRRRTCRSPGCRKQPSIAKTAAVAAAAAAAASAARQLTTPPPAAGRRGRTLLVNYELEAFEHIPRQSFSFSVRPLAGFESSHDAEFLTINPDYTGVLNSDRLRHAEITAFTRREIPFDDLTATLYDLPNGIEQVVRISGDLRRAVEAANTRLIAAQTQAFQQMARDQGELSKEEQSTLSEDFRFEVKNLHFLFDDKTRKVNDLLFAVRKKQCIDLANKMVGTAENLGLRQTPKFKNLIYEPLRSSLNTEERRWLAKPTLDWLPTFYQVEDADASVEIVQDDHESEFVLPEYEGYNLVFPEIYTPLGSRRDLRNQEVFFEGAENVQFADSSDFVTDSSSDDGSCDVFTVSLTASKETGQLEGTVHLTEDEQQSVIEEVNLVSDDEQPGPSGRPPPPSSDSDSDSDVCETSFILSVKRKRQKRSPIEMPQVCVFKGGNKFKEMLRLWY